MLKISHAGRFGLSPATLAQFTLEMRVAAFKIAKKITKTLYFGGSISFKVISVNISKKLVASACYDEQHMSVPISNHPYVRPIRANSGKITSFKEVPLFRPLVCGEPFYAAA